MLQEEEIIKKAQKNKREFDAIYRIYYHQISAYIAGFVKHKENVEDLTSITFEKALKGIDAFQWEGISIQVWLYRIARNTVYDFYRKRINRNPDVSINQLIASDKGKAITLEDIVKNDDEPIEIQVIQTEEEGKLYAMLQTLDHTDQYLLYYKYFENIQNKEIAKMMNLSETNVGTKLQRLREKLKKYTNNG